MKGEGGDRTWGCDACEGEALGVVVAVGMGIALELVFCELAPAE